MYIYIYICIIISCPPPKEEHFIRLVLKTSIRKISNRGSQMHISYVHFKMPSESLKLPGAEPIFPD